MSTPMRLRLTLKIPRIPKMSSTTFQLPFFLSNISRLSFTELASLMNIPEGMMPKPHLVHPAVDGEI